MKNVLKIRTVSNRVFLFLDCDLNQILLSKGTADDFDVQNANSAERRQHACH